MRSILPPRQGQVLKSSALTLALFGLPAGACGNQAPPDAVGGETPVYPVQRTSRSITPLMTLDLGQPRSEIASRSKDPRFRRSPIGGYTRLVLRFIPPVDAGSTNVVRDYDKQKRSALARYFSGKSIARIFTVKANLARPRVSTTTMMTSLGYDSNKRVGETWTSEVNGQRLLTPYFRIDADSAINVETALTATSTYDVTAASDLLDIVKRGASLVAPAATLVTSLNKERFQDASQFVDQSISGLLKESIVERASNDFPMSDWAGQPLATVRVWMSTGKDLTPTARSRPEQRQVEIGRWLIYSTPATLSVFSDTPIDLDLAQDLAGSGAASGGGGSKTSCEDGDRDMYAACVAYRRIEPQTILNFPVDSGVSIGQALAGDSAIASARERLIQSGGTSVGKAGAAAENAAALCTLLADKTQTLGFNRFDVAAILWAYASQSFVTRAAGAELRKPANCSPLKLAYNAGLPDGGFAGADDKRVVLASEPPPPPPPPPPE